MRSETVLNFLLLKRYLFFLYLALSAVEFVFAYCRSHLLDIFVHGKTLYLTTISFSS